MASASESYAVAAQLMLRSNVPEALSAIIEGFEKLDRMVKQTVEGFDKMASAARKSADAVVRAQTDAADRGARAQTNAAETAARAQQRAAERTAQVQQRAADATARRMDRDRDRAERLDFDREARLRRQTAAQEAMAARQMDRTRDMAERMDYDRDARLRRQSASHGHGVSAMDVSMAAGETSGVLRGFITSAGRAALDPAYTMDMLRRDDRVTAADAKGADDAAWAATRSAPGTTYAKNLEAVSDLKNVTGSLSDAVKILPQFANLSAVLAVADRKSGGSGDQAFAAAKAMEVLGQLTVERKNAQTGKMEQFIDPEQLPARLERMAKVAVATMGRVSPTDYLAFAKQARAGGMMLSDEFLYEKLPAMMMVMGGSRAGTAVQSMSQVFQGGKLMDKSFREMKELGLAGDAHEVKVGKKTEIRGKIYEQDLLMRDPAAWANAVHDHLVNGLHMTDEQAMTAVQKFSQRSTIAGMLADLMKDGAGILKEQQNVRHTQVAGLAESNPEGKINALHASLENFLAAMGGPLMEPAAHLVDMMTAALNRAGDWAKANPDEAKIIGEVAVGLFGLAAAVTAVSTALLIYGPVISATKGLMAGRTLAGAVALGAEGAGAGAAAGVGSAAGAGLIARFAASAVRLGRVATPVGAATMAAQLAWTNMTPLTNAQAQKYAPQLAEPHDGFDVEGRPTAPVAPRQSDLVTTRPTGTQDVRVVNSGDLARGYQSNLGTTLSRPPSGPTGFDSTGSVPSHPSTSTP